MQSECIVSAYIQSRIVLYLLPSAVLLLCFVPLCVLFQLIIASPAPVPLSRHQSQWVLRSRGHLDFLAPFMFFLSFFFLIFFHLLPDLPLCFVLYGAAQQSPHFCWKEVLFFRVLSQLSVLRSTSPQVQFGSAPIGHSSTPQRLSNKRK